MTRKCSFKVHHTHSLNWTKVCFLDDFFLKFGIITNTFYCGSQNRVLEKVSLEVLMIDHVDNFVYWVKLIQGLSLDFSVLFPLLPWFDQKVLKQYLWFDQWINTWYTWMHLKTCCYRGHGHSIHHPEFMGKHTQTISIHNENTM